MADTSPGKVQVLRAMFAQKNEPVMGCMKPGVKLNRPCNRSVTSLSDDNNSDEKQRISPVSVTATQALLRAIQTTDHRTKQNGDTNNVLCDNAHRLKPSIGPKPAAFSKVHCRTYSSCISNNSSDLHNKKTPRRICSESNGYNVSKSELAETVASFMFGDSNNPTKSNAENKTDSSYKVSPTPRTSLNGTSNVELPNTGENMKPKNPSNSHLNLINSDNYICKSSSNFRRRPLPAKDKIGPPPLKPVKPPYMKLPERFLLRTNMPSNAQTKAQSAQEVRPTLPPKRLDHSANAPQKPSYPCPPRPITSPPIPPSIHTSFSNTKCFPTNKNSHVMKPKTLFEEIEQLYEDTLSEDSSTMIPEYTQEEEEAELEDLYDDAIVDNYRSTSTHMPHPPKSKYPSPTGHQSLYLEPNVNGIPEEIYHDTDEPVDDEVYEVMPVDELDEGHYSNNIKEMEKIKREEEKRLRKESKEKQKKEKEMEKLKKKFGLNGDESAIDSGLVKTDSRGSRSDLPVKRGETVYILRIEDNPVGKWLVSNKKGKYGYVELTNIEVDPDSVKSVMTDRRSSVISASEELYSEAYSEQEGIYEVTY